MPLKYPEPTAPDAVCDSCEDHAPCVELVDEELDSGYRFAGDGSIVETFHWRVPDGWNLFVASRPIDNPEYALVKAETIAQMGQEHDVAKAALNASKKDLDKDQIAEVEESLAELREDMDTFEPDEPKLVLQQIEGALCPKCAIGLQSRLGLDDWPEEGGE